MQCQLGHSLHLPLPRLLFTSLTKLNQQSVIHNKNRGRDKQREAKLPPDGDQMTLMLGQLNSMDDLILVMLRLEREDTTAAHHQASLGKYWFESQWEPPGTVVVLGGRKVTCRKSL